MDSTGGTVKIGERLVASELITEQQLGRALAIQRETGEAFGRVLVDEGFLEESILLPELSKHLGVQLIDLSAYPLETETVRLLTEAQAKTLKAMVLEASGHSVLVAMVDPSDIFVADRLEQILQRPIKPALVAEAQLLRTITSVYAKPSKAASGGGGPGSSASPAALAPKQPVSEFVQKLDFTGVTGEGSDDAPVVRLVSHMFEAAVSIGASDIHIEPSPHGWRLRQRVDGVLQEQLISDSGMVPALTLRLKLLANMNISERRLPQDGRFAFQLTDRAIDVRISTMPIQFGESVVMRLLDKTTVPLNLDESSMEEKMLERFRHMINRPHGLILVTGPTGSGKTTTLYGALSELNTKGKKIITVEDPVEYQLDRVNQVHVKPKINLTFASVLRTTLRQDPDILLVGEIRDEETAHIAMRASITGHLVLSTLHTNDAIGAAQRLIDMGVPGYLVGSALSGVVAQRLVRKVCVSCAEDYELTEAQKVMINGLGEDAEAPASFRKGAGCDECNNTGFRGRVAVHEFLEVDAALRQKLTNSDTISFAEAAKKRPGYRPLIARALDLARLGTTAMEEIDRLAVSLAEDVVAEEQPEHLLVKKSESDSDAPDLSGLSLVENA